MRPRAVLPVALPAVVLAVLVGGVTTARPFLPVLTDTSPTGIVSVHHVAGLLSLLLNPVAVFLLGRRVGREGGVDDAAAVLGGFVAAGVVGVAVGSAVAGVYVFEAASLTPTGGPVERGLGLLLRSLLTGVPFGFAGFAGAAWAALRTGDGRPATAP